MSLIHLKTSCIKTVPLHIYTDDFTFIVNGKEFKTNKLISDLISPTICEMHSSDPTFDRFIINTEHQGNFSDILNLLNFNPTNISTDDLPFFFEVVEILRIESLECKDLNEAIEITNDNVFSRIKQHEKHSKFYHNRFSSEIEYISSHFDQLCEEHEEELANLSIDTMNLILSSYSLKIETEDDLLKFVNKLYSKNSEYSILYETVLFEHVTSEQMKEFTSIYDSSDMTSFTWKRLSKRLELDAKPSDDDSHSGEERYSKKKPRGDDFPWSGQNEFKGIIRHLKDKSNNQIENEINITASTIVNNDEYFQPRSVTLFDDQNRYFHSQNKENSWLCFDFKDKKVIPTHYTVRSYPSCVNGHNPKTWVIEGSNDNSSWETVDEQVNNSSLNGKNFVHTFTMNKQNTKEYKYIRMRLTGPNWYNFNYLMVDSFEIYGRLIQTTI